MNIKHYRRLQDLTQAQLAGILQVPRTTISMWETNRGEPNSKKLIKIADALNITVDELLREKT